MSRMSPLGRFARSYATAKATLRRATERHAEAERAGDFKAAAKAAAAILCAARATHRCAVGHAAMAVGRLPMMGA